MYKCIASAVLGLALMVAPGALDYGDPAASFHHIMGPLILSFSVIAVWEAVRGTRYLNIPLALAVLLLTPFLKLEVEPVVIALVAGLGSAILSALPNETSGHYGGGWSLLLRREK